VTGFAGPSSAQPVLAVLCKVYFPQRSCAKPGQQQRADAAHMLALHAGRKHRESVCVRVKIM